MAGQGVNVPLSLGPGVPGKDRKGIRAAVLLCTCVGRMWTSQGIACVKHPRHMVGVECVVYDAIVHPDVISDAESDETGTFRHFLCTLVMNYVEQKVQTVPASCATC